MGGTGTLIQRHGITWTLDQSLTWGTFANGDPYVIAPADCDVDAITPAAVGGAGRHTNGSALGVQYTVWGQPFDSYYNGTIPYVEADNVGLALPVTLTDGDTLISTESRPTVASDLVVQTMIDRASVLTVLAAAPAEACFRPWYAGPTRQATNALYTVAQVKEELLQRIHPASYAANIDQLAERFERLQLEGCNGWPGRWTHPFYNMPEYGRDIANELQLAYMALNADVPVSAKRRLLYAMLQRAIDLYGCVVNGWASPGDGGHGSGRKGLILFAGKMGFDELLAINTVCESSPLSDASKRRHTYIFGEDCQTFEVAVTDPGPPVEINGDNGNYNQQQVGLAEWGNKHGYEPDGDNSDVFGDPYRRCCTANTWWGQTLMMHALGARIEWDHEPYFDYVDRYAVMTQTLQFEEFAKDYSGICLSEFLRLRRIDMPGTRILGIPEPGKPYLEVIEPAHAGTPFKIRVRAGGGNLGPYYVVIVRTSGLLDRPTRSYGAIATDGLMFVDPATEVGSLAFLIAPNALTNPNEAIGEFTLQAVEGDLEGDVYYLQCAVLRQDGIFPTQAIKVELLPALVNSDWPPPP